MAEAKEELSLVCPSDIVFCDPGDEVVLSCRLSPAISADSMEIQWWHKADLIYYYKNGQIIKAFKGGVSLSLDDIHNGNVSLTLRDVRTSQTGHYICEVIHEDQTIQGSTFLHISSEHFGLVTPAGFVCADPEENIILHVHLSPETSAVSMNIRWFRGSELIYQYKNGQEKSFHDYRDRVSLSIQELRRGDLSLTLKSIQPSDSGNYTCKVFHDGCLHTGTVHLQLKDIQNRDDARVTHLRNVLKQVQKDILLEKFNILTGPLTLIQKTLHSDEMSHASANKPRRSTSMERLPPTMGHTAIFERHSIESERVTRALGEDQNIIQIHGRFIRPYMGRLRPDQNTEGTTTQEQKQEKVTAEKKRPSIQSQREEILSVTCQEEGRIKTLERSDDQMQTKEKNCKTM